MEWVEVGKIIANLGLIPALGIAAVIIWRKWWDMVDKLVTQYEGVIAKKDKKLEELQARVDDLSEKRLGEYRAMVNDYRDTLEETNRRDERLADATAANHRLLETLVTNSMGGGA